MIHIRAYKDEETFQCTKLEGFDAVRGQPWLHTINPNIDWDKEIVQFILS